MPFYTGDWFRERALWSFGERSVEVRGQWADMLFTMWDSPERGVLLTPAGDPYSDEEMALLVGIKVERYRENLALLGRMKIYSRRSSDGAIYSRRMVSDDVKREEAIAHGLQGGNRALMKRTRRPGDYWSSVLSEAELKLFRRMPGLAKHEDQPEAVLEVLRRGIARRETWPGIFAFINWALSQGKEPTSISAALRRAFELHDGHLLDGPGGTALDFFPLTRKLLDDPSLGARELKQLLSSSNATGALQRIGSLLPAGLKQSTKGGTDKK
jgi:hypothetical protein